VVVKYGGAAMVDEGLKDRVIRDLVLLSTVGGVVGCRFRV